MGKKKKYYAVRKGRKPGIYETWEEAKQQINSFPGADHKSFNKLEDAKAYLHGEYECKCPQLEDNKMIAYVDGSFHEKFYSSGIVICDKKGLHKFSFVGNRKEFMNSRQVAGEILAAIYAMDYAVKNGISDLLIKHDFANLEHWATGKYRTKELPSRVYKYYCEVYRQKGLNISFEKVKAHSGNSCNELADELAKNAKEFWEPENLNTVIEDVKGFQRNQNVSVKIDKEIYEDLKKYLKGEGFLFEIEESDKFSRLKVMSKIMNDKLYLTYHVNTNTLQIQGKAYDAYTQVQLFLSEFLENYNEMLMKTYGMSKEGCKTQEAELDKLLNGAYNDSPNDLRKVLLTAYMCYKESVDIPFPDYSFFIIPAMRCLEAFLKRSLNTSDLSICFDKKGHLKDNRIQNKKHRIVIEEGYNFYRKHRHVHSHAEPYIGGTATIPSKVQANDIIIKAFEHIRDLYGIIKDIGQR